MGYRTLNLVCIFRKDFVKSNSYFSLLVLILFSAFTGYAMVISDQSLFEFGIELMSSIDTAQVVIDLYILAVLAGYWMYNDNKKRGHSWVKVIPFLVITMFFVSIGPLLYICINGVSSNKNSANEESGH